MLPAMRRAPHGREMTHGVVLDDGLEGGGVGLGDDVLSQARCDEGVVLGFFLLGGARETHVGGV